MYLQYHYFSALRTPLFTMTVFSGASATVDEEGRHPDTQPQAELQVQEEEGHAGLPRHAQATRQGWLWWLWYGRVRVRLHVTLHVRWPDARLLHGRWLHVSATHAWHVSHVRRPRLPWTLVNLADPNPLQPRPPALCGELPMQTI